MSNEDAPATQKVSAPLSKEAAEEVNATAGCRSVRDLFAQPLKVFCLSVQLLEPLRLACGQTLPRLVEPALACLHKLVS